MLRGALKLLLQFFSVFYSSVFLQYAMMHAVVKTATAFLGKNINWEWERSSLRVFTVKEAKQVLPPCPFLASTETLRRQKPVRWP
jgi:hypothetical protein